MSNLNEELLAILACPDGKTPLEYSAEAQTLTCKCGLVFPIRDGIPVMLLSEAARPESYEKNGCTNKAPGAP